MTNEPPTHPSAANGPEPERPEAKRPEPERPEPITPVDPLDERLSAGLDGEPAPDGSSDEPRADDRRRALIAARDLLAIPPPPLDDITRRRMLRTAVAEQPATRRRDLRNLNRVAVAAVVLAVVVIGGLALNARGNGSGRNAKSANASKSATTSLNAAAARDLHEVSDPEVLRRRVETLLREEAGAAAPTTNVPGQHSDTIAPDGSETSKAQDRVAGDGCLPAAPVPAGATRSLLAKATFDGAPAIVVVADDGPRTLIYVLATADCRLLISQFLKD